MSKNKILNKAASGFLPLNCYVKGTFRQFAFSVLFFLLLAAVNAQTDSVFTGLKRPKKEKAALPGSNEWKRVATFGLDLQPYFGKATILFFSPSIGYNAFDNFNIGVGGIYCRINKDFGKYGEVSASALGVSAYAYYVIEKNFFVQLQYFKLDQPNVLTRYPDVKTWVDYFVVGGGYRQPLGKTAALNGALMYNLTPEVLSIYPGNLFVQLSLSVLLHRKK